MATTKKTTGEPELTESATNVVVSEMRQQPVQPEKPAKQGLGRQNIITIAIVSGVILFFGGLGLGYLWGHNTSSRFDDRPNNMMNGNFTPGQYNNNGNTRRSSGSSTQQAAPNQSTSQTAPQTQTN